MSFDWKQSSEGTQADLMPEGYHKARVIKVVTAKKDGTVLQSKNGDPQVMAVFANDANEEAAVMFTLSAKAGWILAKFLSCAGADLDRMTKSGITPERFADHDFAEKQLLKRECWAKATHSTTNGKTYCNLDFLHADEVPASALKKTEQSAPAKTQGHEAVTEEEIPF